MRDVVDRGMAAAKVDEEKGGAAMDLHQAVPLMAAAAVALSGVLVFAALPRNRDRARQRHTHMAEFFGWDSPDSESVESENQERGDVPVWGNLDLSIFGGGSDQPSAGSPRTGDVPTSNP